MENRMSISWEQRAVILGSRLTFRENDINEIKILKKQGINWYNVFKYSVKNRVVSLVWRSLCKYGLEDSIPRDLQDVYKMYYLGVKKRNEFYMEELKNLLSALDSNGIKYAYLKGAYLIPNMYKDYGIRTMNDIDVMIRHTDSSQIASVMGSLGYVQGDRDYENKAVIPVSREKQILWKAKMSNLYPFLKVNDFEYSTFTKIDFTCGLEYEKNYEPVNLMIERVEKDRTMGFLTLRPSDFFVHLCCHLYKEATSATDIVLHKDLNLIKFCDVREYILQKMNNNDLHEAISFARECNLEKALYYTLHYLHEIFNDGYESDLLEELDTKDKDFLNKFGAVNYGYDMTWTKSFWERLFAENNEDEITIKPKYFDV